MPTGYTSIIQKGATFKEYALQCARAFGALVHMRDDKWDAPIPDKVPKSDYHEKELKNAIKKRADFEKLGEAELVKMYNKMIEESRIDREKTRKETQAMKDKYEKMLAQAKAYVPPSADHEEYKRFMIEQIESSIEFDCRQYPESPDPTFEEWKNDRLETMQWSIDYHTKGAKEEEERVRGRSQWIQQLKQSLK